MSWQKYKNRGEPIYDARDHGSWIELKRIRRVIHNSSQFGSGIEFSVRYNGRWHPLRSAAELKTRYRKADGTYAIVLLNNRPFTTSDEQLPFVRDNDQPGYHYEVYGW